MAIYRGEGGATDVEPAPGDTEFAGGIIVEGDILSKGKITAEEGFYGDGSNLTNVADAVTLAELGIPNHELITVTSTGATTIPKDLTVNGVTVGEGQGSGLLNTIVGDSAFTSATTGGSNTVLGSNAGKTITSGTGNIVVGTGAEPSSPSVFNEVTIGRPSISTTRLFGEVVAPSFIGNGSLLTDLPAPENVYTKEDVDFIAEGLDDEIALKVDEAPEDGKQYARQDKAWTEVEASDDTYTKAEIDTQQNAQNVNIQANTDAIADLPVPVNTYTKTQIDAQQKAQDDVIDVNTGNISFNTMNIATNKASISTTNAIVASNTAQIATNTGNIATNTSNIASNTVAIQENTGAIDSLTGAIIYKGAINVTDTNAPVDANNGDMYINNYNVDEPDTEYPVTGWGTVATISYNDRIIKTGTDWDVLPSSSSSSDTYSKAQIDAQQNAQDVNISSNTTAIGTLSGQVGQNSQDIAELQDSIFFSSAYSADYPSAPNRDPENGNMYLQNVALFTYSYASATQIFASKTDESGNVRQFTAIKPGDSIVLNEVDSPNYGRYELVTVEDVSDSYVVMNVIPKLGQGTVITGVKVAFQAFPKPGSDSIWTEEDGDAVYDGDIEVNGKANIASRLTCANLEMASFPTTGADPSYAPNMYIGDDGTVFRSGSPTTFPSDLTANGVRVGKGNGSGSNNVAVGPYTLEGNTVGYANTAIGQGALQNNSDAYSNTAVGFQSLYSNTTGTLNTAIGSNSLNANVDGGYNTAVGNNALQQNSVGLSNTAVGYSALQLTTGNSNTAIGNGTGSTLTTGTNNTIIGANANPSSPTVSNEVTIGNGSVTKTRLNGEVTTNQDMTVNGVTVGTGSGDDENNTAVGQYALLGNTTGTENVGIGRSALQNNVSGNENTALGAYSLTLNTGDYNTGVGKNAMYSNTTGPGNTSLGYRSGFSNSTGGNNVALGKDALYANTVENNTAVGTEALRFNTTGSNNVALGRLALYSNTEGLFNTGIGKQALYSNTTANNNTAVGGASLISNVDGESNTAVGRLSLYLNAEGNYNTALGANALYTNTEGDNNTAIGKGALNKNTGNNNVAIGTDAIYNIIGEGNVAIGSRAGNNMTSGSNNILIGDAVAPSSNTVSNEVTIGNDDIEKTRLMGDTSISGAANVTKNLTCANIKMSSFPTTNSDPVYAPNMYIDTDGTIFKSGAVTTYMSKEEITEQLAIKDKLIEKLSARLDSLELKFKALK